MPISMDRWVGKLAVVTGASAGIGATVAERLVAAGVNVVGLARRKNKVEELANRLKDKSGKLYPFQADVSKEEDILQAFKWIEDNLGSVHILINNAGVGRATSLIDGNIKFWKEVLDTNVLGLCVATREAVKSMRRNNVAGHIIHINSVAGHYVPKNITMNVYAASKHAVTALTETLRQELNSIGSKIKISSVSPGYVSTEIVEASLKGSGLDNTDLADVQRSLPSLEASDVADSILYVLATPPHVQVHELTIRPIGELF